jgi:general secretion pathway protein N
MARGSRRGPARAVAAALADTGAWQRQRHASRRWALWGAAAGGLLGLLLAAPASWLGQALADATRQRLLLADARGTVWSGSAVLVLTGGAGSRDAAALPGRLSWTLRPSGLGLRLLAEQACCINGMLDLRWSADWGGYTVALAGTAPAAAAGAAAGAGTTAALGQWPAAWLVGLGAPFNTLGIGGLLQARSDGLQWQSVAGRVRVRGGLQLDLMDTSSRIATLPVLGHYRLQLRGQPPTAAAAADDSATVQLQTLSGALQLSGDGQWTAGGLRFRGQAEAAPGQDAALSNLLNIIGRRQGALSRISIG